MISYDAGDPAVLVLSQSTSSWTGYRCHRFSRFRLSGSIPAFAFWIFLAYQVLFLILAAKAATVPPFIFPFFDDIKNRIQTCIEVNVNIFSICCNNKWQRAPGAGVQHAFLLVIPGRRMISRQKEKGR